MNPTQQKSKSPLLDKVASRAVLYAAWTHVKPRLEKSKDSKIRADAAAFAKNVTASISRLQRALKKGEFQFSAQKGVLKKRGTEIGQPKKEPRPIVIAPAMNRIVQRAILEVCQAEDKGVRRHLGELVTVLNCPTSVGGLPGRGVPDAIVKIKKAIDDGATWFVRSDLKNFFQAVPKKEITKFLGENVLDIRFNELFMKALVTELENEDEVRELIHLFPIGDVGVPQGSALSALCANIALSQFDKKMNGRGVTTIRYLDDFIVLGKGKKSTEAAFRAGEILLKSLGFECHDPFDAKSKKAASGAVITGMQFLSFDIAPHRIAPSKDALNEFLSDVDGAIVDGRKAVSESENSLRRAQPRYTQTLSLLDRKIRGWGDAFGATTDRLVFAQLDEKVDIKLRAFRQWFAKRIAQLDDRQKRRLVGIALLADTPIKIS